MKKITKLFALFLAVVMCFGIFAACRKKNSDNTDPANSNSGDSGSGNAQENTTPLVVGYAPFNESSPPSSLKPPMTRTCTP